MREYMTPDFDVTIYEIDDVITTSLTGDWDGTPDNGWEDIDWA